VCSSERSRRVVIAGAGHAGGTVAALLRQGGFQGRVILVGAEPVGPYHRPPLSKRLLRGELEQPLQPGSFYRDQEIELRTATRVTAIDRPAREAQLSSGETLVYDVLVLATGALARRLDIPGLRLERVYELRTLAHARVLHDVLTPGRRLAVIGGGWIGLEVAASAREAGIDVTVIEREERLLARVASPQLSEYLTARHAGEGVKLLLGGQVSRLEANARGQLAAVVLADGRTIECDRALIGVGADADDELAVAAGLPCDGGVIVDELGRTEDPCIYAVGDMTRRPVPLHDGLLRIESIPSAVEQARQAAAAILGATAPPAEVPWFWSDQFALKLQIAGLVRDTDGVAVRSRNDGDAFAVFHTRGDRLIAVEAVNATAEFMAGRQLIRDETAVALESLADPLTALDGLLAPAAARTSPSPAADVGARGDAPDGNVAGPGGVAGQPQATFIQPDGNVASTAIGSGMTLMAGAVRHNVPGIVAECGGMCSCGTCHVVIEPDWETRLPEPEYEEAELLEFLEGAQPNSRLSCQIVMSDDLDGITVRVPAVAG
jgi:3-phenylpropionate/trans-cinnamate dioxygenase ferredoxin reductase subunit